MDSDPARDGQDARLAVGPDRLDPRLNSDEKRRMKRMLSNRESARRSRMRKQSHLENLLRQLNQHKALNRDLLNRLGAVAQFSLLLRRENEQLLSESTSLRSRLAELHRQLLYRRLQRLSFPFTASVTGGSGGESNISSSLIVTV